MSMTRCLKKLGASIQSDDASAVKALAAQYRTDGMDGTKAGIMAAQDYLGELFEQRAALATQIEEQGGAVPKRSQAQEAEAEEVKPVEVKKVEPKPKPEPKPETEPKPKQESAPAPEAAAPKLDDFGEKLGGAKKDRAPSLSKDITDEEIVSQPLSKIWPAAEIDDIEDKLTAAIAFAARAEVPAKPRKGYKLDRWVTQVKMVRSLAGWAISGKRTADELIKMMANYRLDGFVAKIMLLESVERSQWKRIGPVREYPTAYRFEDSEKVPSPFVSVEIDGKRNNFAGATTITDVLDKANGLLGNEVQAKRMQFDIRGRLDGTEYYINKKGDKERRKLKTFKDLESARNFMKTGYDDLVAAWDKVKDSDNVKKTDVRSAENRPRTGADHRKGANIEPNQFIETFGFRGVEFGNWVGQGAKTKERQGMLNQAYDALLDLAEIAGIPPKAISLNGSMGLAFGSRGSGGASAHFEPGNLVINLTKTKGAGSLSHEWFHALDNYFARQRGGEVSMQRGMNAQQAYRANNFITYRPEPMYVHKTSPSTPITKAQLTRYHKDNPTTKYYSPDNWQVDPKHPEGVRPEVESAFADLVEALDASPMHERSQSLDKAPDGYWSRIIERGARAFENYVISRMMEKGYHNDYLANVNSIEDFPRSKDRYPYLLPEEITPVADAFDGLFNAIESRESPDGNVALFSQDATYPMAPRSEWYGEGTYRADGGRMVMLTPDEFLSAVSPLTMDAESRENIDLLKEHIQSGKTLDPLLIRANGKEDGRHRAYAAKELGISEVPVIVFGNQFASKEAFDPGVLFQAAYHGTPHRFDKFSLAAMGTGEGAQAYGWGLYFASSKDVAEYYRDALSDPIDRVTVDGVPSRTLSEAENRVAHYIATNSMTVDEYISDMRRDLARSQPLQPKQISRENIEVAEGMRGKTIKRGRPGNTYQVDIPEDSELLDWDKALIVQPKSVRKALKKLGYVIGVESKYGNDDAKTGAQVYAETAHLKGGDQEASQYLNILGIPGLRFLDGSSRGVGKGNHNYVIWDEARVTVEAVNDQMHQAEELGSVQPSRLTSGPEDAGTTVESVQAAIAEALDKFNAHGDVTVVQGLNDISKEFERLGLGMTRLDGRHKGFYYKGKVWLVADNIKDARDARITLAHELIGHKGVLRGINADEWAEIRTTIFALVNDGDKTASSIWDEVLARYPHESNETHYKEFLAVAAERREKRGPVADLMAKVRAMLRRFLRSMGLGKFYSDADIENILINSERYLKSRRAAAATGSEKGALMSQQSQTDTPAFRKWFGESVVVDDAGKPLVVYHGTDSEFDVFSNEFLGDGHGASDWGDGFYFTDRQDAASGYGDNVKQVFLQIKNPATKDVMMSSEIQLVLDDGMGFTSAQDALAEKGYDGIVIEHEEGGTEYIVFKPNQIKSSTDNNGDFNLESDNILYSQAAAVETPAFKRWFGKSKVVDEEGRPQVVYHGTNAAFDSFDASMEGVGQKHLAPQVPGFWFATDPRVATMFGSNTKKVYLSLRNPYRIGAEDYMGRFHYDEENPAAFRKQLEAEGYDGMIIELDPEYENGRGPGGTEEWGQDNYIVFKASQIKSATDNNGDFNPDSDSILFSQAAVATLDDVEGNATDTVPAGNFLVGEETKRDLLVRKVQDKFAPVKKMQAAIRERFGDKAITESENVYLAEERVSGIIEEDLRKFEEKYVDKLIAAIGKSSVSQVELDLFLYAKHAKDRNAHIAKINPEMKDGGSGMTNAEADAILAQFDAEGKTVEAAALAELVYDMNRDRLRVLMQAGLETPETIRQWQAEFGDFYVPLKGNPKAKKGKGMRTGKGFAIRGKESLHALGRRSLAQSPTVHTIVQFEESLVRKQKSIVGQKLLRLARKFPNKDYWVVHDTSPENMPKRRVFNKNTMEVEETADISMLTDPQYFPVKENGKQYFIKLEDELLASAMQNMGPERLNVFLRSLNRVNRYLAAINTNLTPEFVFSNAARDVQTAIFNVIAEQDMVDGKIKGESLALKIFTDIPSAMRGVYRGMRGKDDAGQEWQAWFQEYRESGAKIGFFGLHDFDAREQDLLAKLKKAKDGAGPMDAVRAIGDFVSDANGAVENATRLSAYVNARKAGLTKAQAASLSKNLTVNFNRKGELGVFFNSLYLFFNASVQGTATFARVMTSKKAQMLAGAIGVGAYALAELNRMLSDDDEDGESFYDMIPDYEKERNIILMKPGGKGEYFKFPLPYGYNIFHVTGTVINDLANGSRSPQSAAKLMAMAVAGSFNPIGLQESEDPGRMIGKTITPSLLQPMTQLNLNETFYGGPVFRENFPGGTPKPDSDLGMTGTGKHFVAMAKWLNEVTGGSDYRSGAFDVHPETFEHLYQFGTGGAGAFVERTVKFAQSLATDKDIEARDVPIVRRLYGQSYDYEDRNRFETRFSSIMQYNKEYTALQEQSRVKAIQFKRKHSDVFSLLDKARDTDREINRLFRERKELDDAGKDIEAVNKKIDRAVDKFNRDYNRRIGAREL